MSAKLNLSWYNALCAVSAACLLVAGCGTNSDVCKTSGGISVCGEFGRSSYAVDLGGQAVQWPPVAVQTGRIVLARGSELIEVRTDGTVSRIADTKQQLSTPSTDESGALYATGSVGQGGNVLSYNGSTQRWSAPVTGVPAGTPPTLSATTVYAATSSFTGLNTLWLLERATGVVVGQRADASPAAVLADGSIRYLHTVVGSAGTLGSGAPVYSEIVAEGADGKQLWAYPIAAGIVDFAPGPAGETYAVGAGNHQLVRVSEKGVSEWAFTPPCTDCNVAAAPTVANGQVYFPVWENAVSHPVDPLYALDAKTGKLAWTFDGFDTKNTSYSPFSSSGSVTDSTRHHPTGRPVVAADGTLYVSNDGAVAAIDKNGQLLGLALYDASAGEVSWNNSFASPMQTWINPGVRPSPVLAPDGTLYVWDGVTIRAFATSHAAISQAWIAPFGGPSNAGRIPGQ